MSHTGPRAEDPDATLVERFKAGDENAFLEIVARHRHRLHAVADKILNNHADAEEITQDVFIRAYRGLATFRGDSSLATWLHRIATNLARNRYWYFFRRRRQSTVSLDCPNTPEAHSDLAAGTDLDPSEETTVNEFDEWVTICLQRLEEPHREILMLRNALDLSYDEIADELSLKIGTVKSRIARARGDLRTLLSQACPELFPK
jgi:RNA polymerase sigma-70 factor (ECF subfamily)